MPHFFGIEPSAGHGASYEIDEAAHAELSHYLYQRAGVMSQDVESVSKAHQVVKSSHGVPVVRKEVLVVIAVAFLNEDSSLYSPSVTRSQVASFVYIAAVQRFAGEPGVARAFGYGRACFRGDFFPGFLANHHMDDKALSLIRAKAVLDVVYPFEPLFSIAPLHREIVVLLKLLQTVEFFPDARERFILEDYHELPIVLATYLHDRTRGKEAVEKDHDRQM